MGAKSEAHHCHDFNICGPKQFSPINWGDAEHRRFIVACLVQAVYVYRQDLKEERQSLAPPWWESFNFKLFRIFQDRSKVFGAIFKFDSEAAPVKGMISTDKAPLYVAAFRGTQSFMDWGLNLLLSFERLGSNNRPQQAIDEVLGLGSSNIWLAGHSLGASLATFVGIAAAERKGFFYETFLFNPPYLRLDPCTLKHCEIKGMVKFVQKCVWEVCKFWMKDATAQETGTVLDKWVPNLFVNPDDYICKGFIKYFENQHLFKGMKSGNFVRYRDGGRTYDLNTKFGNVDRNSIYLLPSGRLMINGDPTKLDYMCSIWDSDLGQLVENGTLKEAHQLEQWWKKDLKLICREYVKPSKAEE